MFNILSRCIFLKLNIQDNIIYNGCNDNNIYGIDINTGEKVAEFKGHIRDINVLNSLHKSTEIISGSEDSTVKLWDTRTHLQTTNINPFKDNEKCFDWISSIELDDNNNWIGIGGGKGEEGAVLQVYFYFK